MVLNKKKGKADDAMNQVVQDMDDPEEICIGKTMCDGGGESKGQFQALPESHGIPIETNAPYIPQGNSIAKRRFGPIIDITRSLLLGAPHLPGQLWGETLKAAVYFKSRTSTDVLVGKATLDIWESEPHGSVNHMYEWGELVFKQTAIRQNNGKLTTRAEKMRLGGYNIRPRLRMAARE